MTSKASTCRMTQCRQRVPSLCPLVLLLILLFGAQASEAVSRVALVAKSPAIPPTTAPAPVTAAAPKTVPPPKAAPAPVTAAPPKAAPAPVAAKPPSVAAPPLVAKAPTAPAPVVIPPTLAPTVAPAAPVGKVPAPSPKAVTPTAAPVKAPSTAPTTAPSALPKSPAAGPALAPAASGPGVAPGPATALAPSSGAGAALDAAQVKALNLLGITADANACSTTPTTVLQCDGNGTTRHLVTLSAQDCLATATLTAASLLALSPYLKTLSFMNCPLGPLPVPTAKLETGLTSLTVTGAPTLFGWWIGRLTGLKTLHVRDAFVNASSLNVITSNLANLQELTISNASLSGALPTAWPATKLTTLDLSNNDLSGPIPVGITKLTLLTLLDLSNNRFDDHIITAIGDFTSLTTLSMSNNLLRRDIPKTLGNLHFLQKLDLSFNQLNGTIPDALGSLPLTDLDLRNNSLSGAIPFDDLFLSRLKTFKVDGNPDLCYNNTVTSAKAAAAAGLRLCGGALAPAPGPNSYLGPAAVPSSAMSPQTGASPSPKKKPKIIVIVFATLGALVGLAAIVYFCCRYWGAKAGYA